MFICACNCREGFCVGRDKTEEGKKGRDERKDEAY